MRPTLLQLMLDAIRPPQGRQRPAARRRAASGFTIIEVLVVCSIIGVIASITVPTYVSRRAAANEGAVVATLRAISQAQFQFRAQGTLDLDYDGGYEFGTLGELAGVEILRGTPDKLAPRLLSVSLGELDGNHHLLNHGYRFALYLPDGSGVGVPAVGSNAAQIAAGLARDYYTCLAWPERRHFTGNHTYFVNQQGQVMKTELVYYSGTALVPPAGAALLGTAGPGNIDSQTLAVAAVGADGRKWIPVH